MHGFERESEQHLMQQQRTFLALHPEVHFQ